MLRRAGVPLGADPELGEGSQDRVEDDQRPIGDARREAGVQGPVRKKRVHHPDGRVLRVEGRRRRTGRSTPRASRSSSRCSSTASTVNRSPSPDCGRHGRTRRPASRWLHSATVVTTSANATMQAVHDRMPVIRPASRWEEWLDPDNHDIAALSDAVHRAQRRHPDDASGVDRRQQRPQQRPGAASTPPEHDLSVSPADARPTVGPRRRSARIAAAAASRSAGSTWAAALAKLSFRHRRWSGSRGCACGAPRSRR